MQTSSTEDRLRHRLELQSMQIQQYFTGRQVPANVRGGAVRPRSVSFDLQATLSGGFDRLRAMSSGLAATLGVPGVRLSNDRGRWQVIVNRGKDHPVDLLNLMESLGNLQQGVVVLGQDFQDRPVMLNLSQKDFNNVLVSGGSEAGKTCLLRTAAVSLALGHKQSQVQMAVFSPATRAGKSSRRNNYLYPLDYIPHLLFPIVDSMVETAEALTFLADELAYRQEQAMCWPILVVLIDDLDTILEVAGEAVRRPLAALLQDGGEHGLRLIFSASNPNQELLKPLLKHNCPIRLVGRVEDRQRARAATGLEDSQAEYLAGRGDFLAISHDSLLPFQAAFIDDYDLHLCLTALHRFVKPALLARPVGQMNDELEQEKTEEIPFEISDSSGRVILEPPVKKTAANRVKPAEEVEYIEEDVPPQSLALWEDEDADNDDWQDANFWEE